MLALAALGFVTGGLGLVLRQEWWRAAAVGAAVFSMAVFLLLWNGKLQAVDDQGGVGSLINLALLGSIFILKWPA